VSAIFPIAAMHELKKTHAHKENKNSSSATTKSFLSYNTTESKD